MLNRRLTILTPRDRIENLIEMIVESMPRSRSDRFRCNPKLFLPLGAASIETHSNTPIEKLISSHQVAIFQQAVKTTDSVPE